MSSPLPRKGQGELITQQRRRLSVSDPANAEVDGHYSAAKAAEAMKRPENPRGLLNFLETSSLLQIAGVPMEVDSEPSSKVKPGAAASSSSAANGDGGRRGRERRGSFSISGLTDTTQDTFEEKKTVSYCLSLRGEHCALLKGGKRDA